VTRRVPPLRVRMFAGPNGSGKTTVQREISQHFTSRFLGVLVNPDDLEATINRNGRVDLGPFNVRVMDREVREAFTSSAFLQQHGLADAAAAVRCDGRMIDLAGPTPFSFETVMSERGKVDLLREAQALGFRTYLYYVATEDPEINISRVQLRVAQGGHGVPKEKIISRYYRSLGLVREAIRHTDRAYFFDTSEAKSLFVAESAGGRCPELCCDPMPNWFRNYVWDQF